MMIMIMMTMMIIMMTSLTTRTGRGRWTGAQWLVLQPALIQVIIIHISMGLKSMVSTVAQISIFQEHQSGPFSRGCNCWQHQPSQVLL